VYPGTGVRTWKPIVLIIGGQETKTLLHETLDCTQYDGVQHFPLYCPQLGGRQTWGIFWGKQQADSQARGVCSVQCAVRLQQECMERCALSPPRSPLALSSHSVVGQASEQGTAGWRLNWNAMTRRRAK
jgi:hypothetical protein